MPLVMMRAADMGRTGYEGVAEMNADAELKARVAAAAKAALAMGLGDVTSKTYPKMCLIAPPRDGEASPPAASSRTSATTRSACWRR